MNTSKIKKILCDIKDCNSEATNTYPVRETTLHLCEVHAQAMKARLIQRAIAYLLEYSYEDALAILKLPSMQRLICQAEGVEEEE